jgi:uncharacterized membrane protein YtjA (UPF0391 family)
LDAHDGMHFAPSAGGKFCRTSPHQEEYAMLRYALIFLVIALCAAALGLFGLEGAALEAARILFVVFLVMLIINVIAGRRVPI